jgi:hypothetical protein
MSFEPPHLDRAEKEALDALLEKGMPFRVRRLEERDAVLVPMLVAKVAVVDARSERLETKVSALIKDIGAPRVERTQIREGGRESLVIEPASGMYLEHEKTRAELQKTRESVEAARAEIDETGNKITRMEKRLRSKWRGVGQAVAIIILTAASIVGAVRQGAPGTSPTPGAGGK